MKRENKPVRTSINLFTDSGINRWNLEERERERERERENASSVYGMRARVWRWRSLLL